MKRLPLVWKSPCERYTVNLSPAVLRSIIDTADNKHPLEVGSQLLGRYADDGFDAYLEEISPVPRDSESSRGTFMRGTAGLRAFFRRLQHRHGHKVHYLGEWHSHPGGAANASITDDRTLNAIARDDKANCSEAILIIVGGTPSKGRAVCAYVYSRKRGRIDLTPERQQ